jgi:hypothetical protein
MVQAKERDRFWDQQDKMVQAKKRDQFWNQQERDFPHFHKALDPELKGKASVFNDDYRLSVFFPRRSPRMAWLEGPTPQMLEVVDRLNRQEGLKLVLIADEMDVSRELALTPEASDAIAVLHASERNFLLNQYSLEGKMPGVSPERQKALAAAVNEINRLQNPPRVQEKVNLK